MRPERIFAAPARAGIVLVALVLLWRVIQVNAVLYGEDGRPRLAPASPTAIAAPDDESASLAAALRDNPAQVPALLLLARGFERGHRDDQAARAYEAAYRLAPLDREVLLAGSAYFLRVGNVPEALVRMDRLVASYPEEGARVFPVMAAILAGGAGAAWDRIIAAGPAWAGAFIVSSCAKGVEPALLLPLFMSRAAAGSARPDEAACLVDRLRRANRWDEAYQVWLDTLPRDRLSEVGSIFNGGFEYTPSGLGFDWIATRLPEREAGHRVEITRIAGGGSGKRALKVSYNGKRQEGAPIRQYLALAPGRYEVSGLGRSDSMRVGRGVQWTARCAKDAAAGEPLGQSERFTGSSEWRRFEFELDVPPACPGQLLQLEPAGPSGSAAYLSGAAWFDELSARRAP